MYVYPRSSRSGCASKEDSTMIKSETSKFMTRRGVWDAISTQQSCHEIRDIRRDVSPSETDKKRKAKRSSLMKHVIFSLTIISFCLLDNVALVEHNFFPHNYFLILLLHIFYLYLYLFVCMCVCVRHDKKNKKRINVSIYK